MASKDEVAAAQRDQQIKSIERRGLLDALNECIAFGVSKLLGLGGMTVGGLEALDPNILTNITLNNPEWYAATGVALLTGKSVLKLIAKVNTALGGSK